MKYLYPRTCYKCGAILFTKDKNHIVLVENKHQKTEHYGKSSIGLPKGTRKFKESCEKCAEREVFEETGFSVSINAYSPYIILDDIKYFLVNLDKPKDELLDSKAFNINDTNEISKVSIKSINYLLKSSWHTLNRSLKQFLRALRENRDNITLSILLNL